MWESADSGANAARDAVGPPSGDACARLLHVPKVRESKGATRALWSSPAGAGRLDVCIAFCREGQQAQAAASSSLAHAAPHM